MNGSTLPVAVRWSGDGRAVELLDQTRLPNEEAWLRIESAAAMAFDVTPSSLITVYVTDQERMHAV